MRIFSFLLVFVCWTSFASAAQNCYDRYGQERDRNGLNFVSSLSQENFAKELLFQENEGTLSALIFSDGVNNDRVQKTFELLLAANYQEADLSQINPERLTSTYSFAKKLVFPMSPAHQQGESYLLFFENNCHVIFRWAPAVISERNINLKTFISKVRAFSGS